MSDDHDNETEDERFDRLYNARRQAEREAETRQRKLKDMGLTADVLDAIGDAVLGAFDRRIEQRRKDEDDSDQPPSTGKGKKPGFLQNIGLAPAANDD